jgi:Xaa-Pro aminopeptidase
VGTLDTPIRPERFFAAELRTKADLLQATLERHDLAAIRLRGQDWFAWATCGGSNGVVMATDVGVAEVLVTRDGICVLTDAIEAERLRAEEVPDALEVVKFGWAVPAEHEAYVHEASGGGRVASDRPADDEASLPPELVAAKRRLLPAEIDRYRSLGRDAASAMSEALAQVTPDLTELDVAAIGAAALYRRGIDPALILVAGARRLPAYRHPRPTGASVGDRVGVVCCGRRSGLFANLTRFVAFRDPTPGERRAAQSVASVEAAAFHASRPGATLGDVLAAIIAAYARLGHPRAELGHHQGGTTGYRSREVVARPGDPTEIDPPLALAWNPSLPGAKIEDTVLRTDEGIEILTLDPAWPAIEVDGRRRPDVWVRT